MTSKDDIITRKKDHLKIALSAKSQIGDSGFDKYRFVHNALPEIDFEQIDTSTEFLGKKVNHPFFISCMTGGVAKGKKINRNLAKMAQKHKIAMGVGSQRAAIEHSDLRDLFMAREVAPDIPLFANIGLVQLNYGFTWREYQACVDMIEADALVVHINPIQEIIQPEGDRNWSGLVAKLEEVVQKLSVPVVAKEVGFGLSEDAVKRLYQIGVRIFDTAGWGGTNWSYVEAMRGKADKDLGLLFSDWGIPTTQSIKVCSAFRKTLKNNKPEIIILGSGGVRNGIQIAKALCLGADLAGLAGPFGKAAMQSSTKVDQLIGRLVLELKTAMFGVGASSIRDLKKISLQEEN